MNTIVEGIYRRGANISINLMKGQRSNCTGVQGIRGGENILCYLEWIFQQWRIQIYLISTKEGALYP